jgi:hypothetical protein
MTIASTELEKRRQAVNLVALCERLGEADKVIGLAHELISSLSRRDAGAIAGLLNKATSPRSRHISTKRCRKLAKSNTSSGGPGQRPSSAERRREEVSDGHRSGRRLPRLHRTI